MKTIAQLQFGLDGIAKFKAMSTQNGMTPEQCAAAILVQSLASDMTAEHKAVLADQSKALPALARIASLPAGDDAQDRFTRALAAVLA